MGILNVTPDSFSDGGKFQLPDLILTQVGKMITAGVDIIDIGGESSRPFSEAVPVSEELSRVIPAIRLIRTHFPIPISIDTTKAEVARKSLEAGADMINDISGVRSDPDMIEVLRQAECPVVIMHMLGNPKTMQVNPEYDDVITEIKSFLLERVEWCVQHGVAKKNIIVDPGIGFGKSVPHNLSILKHLEEFTGLGCPILIGHSRKSFIGNILNLDIDERDTATAVISAFAAIKGAAIIRVHDVLKTAQAIKIMKAIAEAP